MDLAAILLLIALLLGVGLFLAAPWMGAAVRRVSPETLEVSALMAERDRVISSLQDLDFDLKLGKVPQEDYPAQRADLLERGASILRKLDSLQPSPIGPAAGRTDAETRLERAAAAGRADSGRLSGELGDDKIESMLAARRSTRNAKSAGFCPRCGRPVLVSDQFCPNCGKALT
jgi:hypothetical protein